MGNQRHPTRDAATRFVISSRVWKEHHLAGIERRTRVEIICCELVSIDGSRMHEAANAKILVVQRSSPLEETYATIQRSDHAHVPDDARHIPGLQ